MTLAEEKEALHHKVIALVEEKTGCRVVKVTEFAETRYVKPDADEDRYVLAQVKAEFDVAAEPVEVGLPGVRCRVIMWQGDELRMLDVTHTLTFQA